MSCDAWLCDHYPCQRIARTQQDPEMTLPHLRIAPLPYEPLCTLRWGRSWLKRMKSVNPGLSAPMALASIRSLLLWLGLDAMPGKCGPLSPNTVAIPLVGRSTRSYRARSGMQSC